MDTCTLGEEVAFLKDHHDELSMLIEEDIDIPEEEEEGEEHPLANSIVASTILSYLSLEDLKSSRQVCRYWDEEARVHLSRKVKVVLHSEERLKNYIYEFVGDRGFFDTVQLGPYMYMGNDLADRFFQLYGLYIKHLILHKTQCSAIHLREIMFRWAPNVEELTLCGMTPGKSRFLEDMDNYDKLNLHNLKVVNLNLMLTQGEDLLRDFLYDLFSVSLNLQKITVLKNTYKGFLACLISTLLESPPDLPLDNLAHVDALFSFGDCQIAQLTCRRFPLESLNMQLMPNVTLDLLLPLLESLSCTLKNLRLYFYLTRFKELPTHVRLDKVENLQLETYQGSLKFISQLPEIKQLSVTMKCLDELEDAFPKTHHGPGFWSCPTLRSFSATLSVVEGCPSSVLACFESVFPGLRSINLQGITDIGIKLLCSTYPKLEELSAPLGLYTDMGITGIPESKLRWMSRNVNLSNLESIRTCDSRYSGNIASLTKLKKLRLQSSDITDDTIFFAILLLKDLKELSIERSDITDKGLDAITNYMDLQRLSITLCTRVSGPQLEVVKAKMKNRNLILNFDGKRYCAYD